MAVFNVLLIIQQVYPYSFMKEQPFNGLNSYFKRYYSFNNF